MKRLYQILGIDENASEKEIITAIEEKEKMLKINYNIGYFDAEKYHKASEILAEAKILIKSTNQTQQVTIRHAK